jgi:hypothetical protein
MQEQHACERAADRRGEQKKQCELDARHGLKGRTRCARAGGDLTERLPRRQH